MNEPKPQPPRSKLALSSVIFGVLGLAPWTAPVVAALVTGVLGLRETRTGRVRGGGWAAAGLVLGIAGLARALTTASPLFF
ncbi:hypothetical protein HNP84_005527 [Thermocatellispora tengchongensis]|uniref:DUF4190 domain-containing protein n=1 Tax=Thermocatellispora tengchongensis TaxID=1073253 RepID=A0A840PCX0_9ACTN|nr:DUF4190 domain-containing protein [Thermocatellispora tengchongensis]MBB5135783.1 hypothetical protein [Thermocatellispora tengchongensis]